MADPIVPTVDVDRAILDRIFTALKKKGVRGTCPECGSQRELQPGFTHHSLHPVPKIPDFYFPANLVLLPVIHIICPKCGHSSQFAYNILTYGVEEAEAPTPAAPKRHLSLVKFPENREHCPSCGKEVVKEGTVDDIYAVCETCPKCSGRMCSNLVCPHCGFDTAGSSE